MSRVTATVLVAAACLAAHAGDQRTRPGLEATYFMSHVLTREALSRIDATIDFDWGTKGMEAGVQGFSARWTGLVRGPADGEVTFTADADDGCRLRIDGKVVFDGWKAGSRRSGSVRMQQGKLHPILLEYYQNGGSARIRLSWEWAGMKRHIVPADALSHAEYVPRQFPAPDAIEGPMAPVPDLNLGPFLMLDDALVEHSEKLKRTQNHPTRLPAPVVTSQEHHRAWQPHFTAIRYPSAGLFRLWYNSRREKAWGNCQMAHLESKDGVQWPGPGRDLCAVGFGAAVLDGGPSDPQPERRFKAAYWGRHNELHVAFSADGIRWKEQAPGDAPLRGGDIIDVYWDPLRRRYGAITKQGWRGQWTDRNGKRHDMGIRAVGHATSRDFVHWTPPRLIFVPDERDEGEMQWYSMGSVMLRGPLLVGIAKVLRDDLPAEPGGEVKGIGYSALAYSRDGETWTRLREPFLDRNPKPGTWDRAMTWTDSAVLVGDELLLYYGGYARGHKVAPHDERQIGLAKLPRDRYLSLDAGDEPGMLRTRPLVVGAAEMTVNADARGGEIRVQLLDEAGQVRPGFAFADCEAITGNSLAHPVRWKGELAALRHKTVRVEMRLRNARLYAFEFRE